MKKGPRLSAQNAIVNMLVLAVALLGSSGFTSATTCNAIAKGWYSPNGYQTYEYHEGVPPATQEFTYQLQPGFLTCFELEEINRHCVARINEYRAGLRLFSDSTADAELGILEPLENAVDKAQCQAEINLGDAVLMSKTCIDGAHKNAWACNGSNAQNSCCMRPIEPTFEGTIAALNTCLQSMWDEGRPSFTGEKGHWRNMKTPGRYVSCGVAFSRSTRNGAEYVTMQQNFYGKGGYSGQIGTVAPSQSPTQRPTLSPTPPTPVPTISPTTSFPTQSPSLTPQCGNGIVEQGEQCDCGEDCAADTCCNGQTCQYTTRAVCSAQDACCNVDTCAPKKAGVICRAAADDCDSQETCNGVSGKCPIDTKKPHGATCGNDGTCSPCGNCVPTMNKTCVDVGMQQTCSSKEEADMCNGLYCNSKNDNVFCFYRQVPETGTKCGTGMYCSEGMCVTPNEMVCPTGSPTKLPTPVPTRKPSREPSAKPTRKPTREPTVKPSKSPFGTPTRKPSKEPTVKPTRSPTATPTKKPSKEPTLAPTRKPSKEPTVKPTRSPTATPTKKPSKEPTVKPTRSPTGTPTTKPSKSPTPDPTRKPTMLPTAKPSKSPTATPTRKPSKEPTSKPTKKAD